MTEQTLKITTLRMPAVLLDRLAERARRNRRSRSQEIIVCLEEALGEEAEQASRSASAGGAPAAGEASRA